MSTAVRLAEAADAEAISQLILAALHSSNARDYPADVIARVAGNFTPDAVRELLKRRRVLVAVQDEAIVATASLDGNVVRSVFVDPALQGQGIGRLLMIEIELRAREAGVTVLSVPSSLTAEPFYTKLGFHTVRNVYHGNERTVVMEKALSSRHPIGPYPACTGRRWWRYGRKRLAMTAPTTCRAWRSIRNWRSMTGCSSWRRIRKS